ncbi:MAG: hypothetical protein H6702_06775 [Myxococcales bacterium]|nr:hypothetical protein [Myxococcales bacterium]
MRRALTLAATAALTLGCTSHLERAQRQWGHARLARAKAGAPGARPALQAALEAARASQRAEEETEGQAALLEALARAELEPAEAPPSAQRLAALQRARAAPGHAPDTTRAATCRAAASGDWQHLAALCWGGLLATEDGALRAAAAEGYGNASARRLPDLATLRASLKGLPVIAAVFDAAAGDPGNVDLLAVLAARLEDGCGEAAFDAQVAGWRRLQLDVMDGALALDGFRDHDRRCGLWALRAKRARVPLCGAAGDPPGPPLPAARPGLPACPNP